MTLVTKTMVIERGWSAKMVSEILGAPDLMKKVRGRKNLVHLYALDRVKAAEKTETFAVRLVARLARGDAGAKAAETKAAKTIADAEKLPIVVVRWPIDEVRQAGVDHWNSRSRTGWISINTAAPELVDRHAVNFIRHELTTYDEALDSQSGKIGRRDAVDVIRWRILGEIERIYPELAGEVRRQVAARLEAA